MSDEIPPAPLRLKPRVKTEVDNPAAAPASAVGNVAATSSSSEAPKLKLRPKLDTTIPADPNAVDSAAPSPAPSVPPSLGLKPRLVIAQPDTIPLSSPPPAPSDVGAPPSLANSAQPVEPPKFKLKEKSTAATNAAPSVPAAVPAPPILAPAPVQPPAPPPFPVVANPSPKPSPSLPPPKVKPPSDPVADQAVDPGQSSFAKVILLVAGLVLIAGVYYGYKKLTAPSGDPEPAIVEAPKRPSTPSKTLNDLSAVPAQAIAKAEAVVAAVNANEAAGVDEVLAEQEMPVRPPRKTAPKPVEKPAATMTSTELAPGIKASTAATDVNGDANPAFRTWVAQARVSGVFQGSPARVLINGKTVAAGSIVDDALQITFEGIDSNAKLLIFRDASGVSVTRKF